MQSAYYNLHCVPAADVWLMPVEHTCVPILVLNELLAKGLAMNRITKPLCTYLPTYPLTPGRVHTVGP